MLLGLGGMFWFVQARIALGPTPTPTPTRGTPMTATPDFLATRVAEDFLTQQAYQMALLGTTTPTPRVTNTATPEIPDSNMPPAITPFATNTPNIVRLPGLNAPFTPTPSDTPTPDETIFAEQTPTSNVLNLPIVADNSPLVTPTPAQVAEGPPDASLATPTDVPPTETPTMTLPPPDTATPTPTETLPPPSPTATAIPPGQTIVVGSLIGYVGDRVASLRLGPSNIYTATTQLAPDTRLTVLRRNLSGEWLYVCCVENQNLEPAWVRQAYIDLRDNPLPSGAPEDANPNNVGWLSMEGAPAHLAPIPTPVPPLPDDYPLYRFDRQAAGRVRLLPRPPFNPTWSQEARAGLGLVSPVVVGGNDVMVGSADNHLYSFERASGSQRWRRELCQDGCRQFTQSPMLYEDQIFIADQSQTLWGYANLLNPNLIWRVAVDQPVISSFNIFSDTLFLATGTGGNHTLLALDIDNGAERWRRTTSGPGLRYPAIGDQLVYAADGIVIAYDVIDGEEVWRNESVQNVIAGPVYGAPGVDSLAELYVVTNNNRIYALDANTGRELWNIDNGEAATSLALHENALFVAGDGYIKAISRYDRAQRWRTAIGGGPVMGGPLVDADRVLIVTQAGLVHLLENASGSPISVPSITSSVAGGPAISGAYIFVPGTDGRLYALLGSQ